MYVSDTVYPRGTKLIPLLKARPAAQQRYFEKDIFGSDSELSDAPDAEGM
jgi:hypothetical protein